MSRTLPKQTGGKKALTILLGILTSLLLMITVGLFGAQKVVSEENIATIIRTIASSKGDSVKLSKTAGITTPDMEKDADLADIVYEMTKETVDYDALGMDVKDIRKIIRKSNLDEFLAEKAGDYMDELAGKGHKGTIDESDVMEFISENKELIYEETGIKLSKDDMKNLEKTLKEKVEWEELDAENIVDNMPELKKLEGLLNLLRNKVILFILLGVSLLFCILMILVNIPHPVYGINGLGITLIVSGILSLVLSFAGSRIVIAVLPQFLREAVRAVSTLPVRSMMLLAGFAAVCGILFTLITGIIIRVKRIRA